MLLERDNSIVVFVDSVEYPFHFAFLTLPISKMPKVNGSPQVAWVNISFIASHWLPILSFKE